MVKFGSARISENGTANGQRGDSTGYEVCEQAAYWHKNGWRGIRAKDPNVANAIAWWMKCACRSDIVGYSQVEDGGRYLIFFTNLDVPTNADCSTLVPWCVIKAGIDVNVDEIWTGNLIERLLETGAFEVITIHSLDALCTGDILVDGNLTSHTVVVTEGCNRPIENVFDEPNPTLSVGDSGTEVRKLQAFFNEYGDGCTVDGDFGFETLDKVCTFQRIFGLKVDGIYGIETHNLLCFYLYERGVTVV